MSAPQAEEATPLRAIAVLLVLSCALALAYFCVYAFFALSQLVMLPVALALVGGLCVIASFHRNAVVALFRVILRPCGLPETTMLASFLATAFVLFLLVARIVLDSFYNSGDELAFVMQAQTFRLGRLWVPAPPLWQAFRQAHFLVIGDRWMSQYLPGWPAVIALFTALGLPDWSVNPVIATLSLAAFYRLARLYSSRAISWLGTLLLATAPFYVLNAGSFFSHTFTAFLGMCFGLSGHAFLNRGRKDGAFLTGIMLGLMGLTRLQNALIFAAALLVDWMTRKTRPSGIWLIAAGAAPFVLVFLGYNEATTGSAFVTAQSLNKEPFGAPSLDSIWVTIELFVRLIRSTSPLLLVGYFYFLPRLFRSGKFDFCDLVMPITVAVFLCYDSQGGNQYGARYYFEAWPFAVLSIVKGLEDARLFEVETAATRWTVAAVVVSLLYNVCALPGQLELAHRVIFEREIVYREVRREGIHNAIVFICVEVGHLDAMNSFDLIRDGLDIRNNDVVYAHDIGSRNEAVMRLLPGRRTFLFCDDRLTQIPARS